MTTPMSTPTSRNLQHDSSDMSERFENESELSDLSENAKRLVSDPTESFPLASFISGIKKSGVKYAEIDFEPGRRRRLLVR